MQYLNVPGQEEKQKNFQPFQRMENNSRPLSRVVSPVAKPPSPPPPPPPPTQVQQIHQVVHQAPPLSPRSTY